MVDIKDNVFVSSKIVDLTEFVGEESIRKFSDFSSSNDEGVYFVVACYFDVVEGVDMWHHDLDGFDGQRFRLKIKPGDFSEETVFVLHDEVVKKIAPETCKLLGSMKEALSLYPDEMESMVGDPILFKVSKKFHDGLEDATAYEVLDVCYDPSLVGMFISQYLITKSTKKDSAIKYAEFASLVGHDHIVDVAPPAAHDRKFSKAVMSSNKRRFADVSDEVEDAQFVVLSKAPKLTRTYIILE